MANIRKNKNHITSLKNDSETVSSQSEKHRLTFEHFQQHIGTCCQRKHRLNFAAIQWQPRQLQHLDMKAPPRARWFYRKIFQNLLAVNQR
jgi:hypothetical protein